MNVTAQGPAARFARLLAGSAVLLLVAHSVGCGALRPGCCDTIGCCEPACGVGVGCCEPACGCEPDCCCEPACGVGGCCGDACGCCAGGRSMAGQKWCGCDDCGPSKPLINVCTGPACCGCEPACCCEPACGCAEPCCGCEPACGCEPCCGVGGCGDACCCGGGCPLGEGLRFGAKSVCCEVRRLLSPLGVCCCAGGCGGCDGESYWSEWHNDPPRCCDPCDDCGNWVGPTASMRAPYDHQFSPRRIANGQGDAPIVR